tara:strand:- start:474 stop:953 length:480 start_codon:yes stop_codon:yes gene_type:complete
MKINKRNLQKLIVEELTSVLREQAMTQDLMGQARGEAEQAANARKPAGQRNFTRYIDMDDLSKLTRALQSVLSSQIEGNAIEIEKAAFTAGSLIELLHGVVEFITTYQDATSEDIKPDHKSRLLKLHAIVDGRDSRTNKKNNSALVHNMNTNLYRMSDD